jgi:hypothetical protein
MNREEKIEQIAKAIAGWSCYHKDDPPKDEKHRWVWELAEVINKAQEE